MRIRNNSFLLLASPLIVSKENAPIRFLLRHFPSRLSSCVFESIDLPIGSAAKNVENEPLLVDFLVLVEAEPNDEGDYVEHPTLDSYGLQNKPALALKHIDIIVPY